MIASTDSVPLLARTLDLVQSAPRSITYSKMAQECGVSVAWISRFAASKIDNPGIVTVQCLHDYLVKASAEK
ncbi:hypothetical protein [Sphingomonas phage Birtae]|nr:hypothetical protein [Sphingomonas phage Birtae]